MRLCVGLVAAFVAGLTSNSPRIYRHVADVASPGEGESGQPIWQMPNLTVV